MNNTQKESPFNNPRFLLVLAITFLALWGWQYYINKKYPPPPPAAVQAQQQAQQSPADQLRPAAAAPATAQISNQAFPVKQFDYADENVSFTITTAGFGFTNFELNKYKNRDAQQLQFANGDALFSLQIDGKLVNFDISVSSDKLTYSGLAYVDGKEIRRSLTYDPTQQAFTSKLIIPDGLESVSIVVVQNKIVPKSSNFLLPSFDHQDFIYVVDGKTESERITGIEDTEVLNKTASNVSMISLGSQYFVTALVNRSEVNPSVINKVEGTKAYMTAEYNLKNVRLTELNQVFYIGAKKTEVLQAIDSSLTEVLNYGIFGFISKILLSLMKFIYSFVGNWGVAIVILTIVVRTLLLPLNIMSFRSAQAMQKIKPKMDAIKERYKGDPMRINKETMDLMKQNNANPLSGCLPMLLQIPIFFAFFVTISTSVELYHQPFIWWIKDLSAYDPYFILPILMGVTMYFQQKLTPTTMDPMQQKILNFMPIIFTLFLVTLPSGLTLYNFISALFGATQQYFMLKDKRQKNA